MTSLALALLLAAEPAAAHGRYDREDSKRLAPLLSEVLRFRTLAGNAKAHADQKAWLLRVAKDLGLLARDAGPVTELELAGPAGAPVLGLVVHGDVADVDDRGWSSPPFSGLVKDGVAVGRGVADDKGPLVVALLAMKAMKESGAPLTHTLRLLVGSDEESGSTDMKAYLASHPPPDYSLVLDSEFPVVVGEKAWNALTVAAPLAARAKASFEVTALEAGLATSIVPDEARIALRWTGEGEPAWGPFLARIHGKEWPEGISFSLTTGRELGVVAKGRAAHAGVNLEGGANALVALAVAMEGLLPAGGADDLLAFARIAGKDLHGTGLGLDKNDPLWGRYAVNVATLKPKDGKVVLTVNLRRPPPLTGPQLQAHLEKVVADFAAKRGTKLTTGGFYGDEPLVFDPEAKLVRRLLAAYARATGARTPPAVSGGGSYAKRLPNAIAFGMWFPGKPYPGHGTDEKMALADLHRGAHVLIEALLDIGCGPKILEPFKP